jgi:hypothetical protein
MPAIFLPYGPNGKGEVCQKRFAPAACANLAKVN